MNQFKLKKIIKNNLKKIRNESYFSLCYKFNEIKNSDDMVLLTILNNEINEELKKIELVEIEKKIKLLTDDYTKNKNLFSKNQQIRIDSKIKNCTGYYNKK